MDEDSDKIAFMNRHWMPVSPPPPALPNNAARLRIYHHPITLLPFSKKKKKT